MPGAPPAGQPAPPPQPAPRRSALLYGNISMNLIQGADRSGWSRSPRCCRRAGCAVTLVLSSPVHNELMLAPLLGLPGVRVRRPYEEGLVAAPGRPVLSAEQASRLLCEIDAEHPHDLVLLRGWGVAAGRRPTTPSAGGCGPTSPTYRSRCRS